MLGVQKDASGTYQQAEIHMIHSPKSFDEQYPDIDKDLNLESLSNGDLSRVDAQSM